MVTQHYKYFNWFVTRVFQLFCKMDHSQIEFISENQLVMIEPNFNHTVLNFIQGDIGPFIPGIPIQVPLWMAKHLSRRQQCRIIAPDWLNVPKMLEIKEQEEQNETFTPLPDPHFFELCKTILSLNNDNSLDVDGLRTAIKDIYDIRSAKSQTSVKRFIGAQGSRAQVDNLTRLEINDIGKFLTPSLDQMLLLKQAQQQVEDRNAANADSQAWRCLFSFNFWTNFILTIVFVEVIIS